MEDVELAYMFGRHTANVKSEVKALLGSNINEFKEIMTKFHSFFVRTAKEKKEEEEGRISHRFAVLLYCAVKLYFFSNWRLANIDLVDILALETALTEIALEATDEMMELVKKEKENDINVR